MKRDGREKRDLAPTALCTRQHVEVLTEGSFLVLESDEGRGTIGEWL